jgi:hypothetical protein
VPTATHWPRCRGLQKRGRDDPARSRRTHAPQLNIHCMMAAGDVESDTLYTTEAGLSARPAEPAFLAMTPTTTPLQPVVATYCVALPLAKFAIQMMT